MISPRSSVSEFGWIVGACLMAASTILSACNDHSKSAANSTDSASAADPQKALIAKGRTVYQSVCIACHNSDPKKSGSLGPDVWGSSPELLKLRIKAGQYPEGYKPKRSTHVMQPLPQVEKDLPALHAYLNAP